MERVAAKRKLCSPFSPDSSGPRQFEMRNSRKEGGD